MEADKLEVHDKAAWHRRLTPHVAVVAALFLALAIITPTTDITLPDEGVYLAQAAALVDGGWWTERALPELDESAYTDAVIPELTRDSEMVPYSRHPLFPLLLSVGFLAAGPTGALVVSLLALLVAAVASARLAARIDPHAEIPTFYLVALGSPLLFSGWQVSAHAVAAAAAALGALCTANFLHKRQPKWLIGIAAAAGTCVMMRSEGLVLCAAASAVLLAVGGSLTLRSRRVSPALIAGAVVVFGSGVAALGELLWARSINGTGATASALDRVEAIERSPGKAAWISLLQPWDDTALNANVWLILAVVALLAAALAWRVTPSRPLAASALLALACGSAVAAQFAQPALVNGFLPAFPALGAGLLLIRRDLLRNTVVAGLLTTCALSAIVLCFVIYDDGGSTQWGGRFFHFLVPLLAPVVAVSGIRALGSLSSRSRTIVVAGIALVAVSISAIGVRTEINFRDVHHRIRLAADRVVPGEASGISSGSVLLVATRSNDGFSRTFWRRNPDYVTIRAATSSAFTVLRKLHEQGLEQAYVLTPADIDLMELGGRFELKRLGWKRMETHSIPGMSVKILRYGPAKAAAGK